MGRWLAIVLVLIGASSYGLLSSFIKMAYDQGYTDGQITPAQMTMGTLFVWLLILFHKKSWANPFKGPWVKLGLIGIFGLSLTTVFYNIALQEFNASLSIILLFQFTWMTIGMDCIRKRRLPTKSEGIAVALHPSRDGSCREYSEYELGAVQLHWDIIWTIICINV